MCAQNTLNRADIVKDGLMKQKKIKKNIAGRMRFTTDILRTGCECQIKSLQQRSRVCPCCLGYGQVVDFSFTVRSSRTHWLFEFRWQSMVDGAIGLYLLCPLG
jgi:hypothetical protein